MTNPNNRERHTGRTSTPSLRPGFLLAKSSPSEPAPTDQPSLPLIDAKDMVLLGLLPTLALLSWLTPERRWPAIATRLAALRWASRGALSGTERARITAIVGAGAADPSLEAYWRSNLGHKYHSWLQLLRCYQPRRYQVAARLEGNEHIQSALAAGGGAILWVATFAYSDLLTKLSLCRAGYAINHLSRASHGFSNTRFGRTLLNPIQTRIERRFLAERLVMSAGNTVGPLRALTARLADNQLVSITATPLGKRLRTAHFLDGRIQIATGALGLAHQSGAPVLPVVTVAHLDGTFVTYVEPALPAYPNLPRDQAMDAMFASYLLLLETYVRRYPDQFCFTTSEHETAPLIDAIEPTA